MPRKNNLIMVVDDDPIMQKISERLLSKSGYEVISCSYGEECLYRVMTEQPDAVLMDVMLPDGNGKEFAIELRENERTKHIPVIFITSTIDPGSDNGYEIFTIQDEPYYAFSKPPDMEKIVSIIRKSIDQVMV